MTGQSRRRSPAVGRWGLAVLMFCWAVGGVHFAPAAAADGDDAAQSRDVHVGITRPLHMAQLAAIGTSRIARIEVAEGQLVREGDLLVVLDDGVQQVRTDIARENASSTLAIEQAAQKKAHAETELKRFEQLGGHDKASLKELDDARFAANTAALEHKEAVFKHEQNKRDHEREKLLLERLHIRAPFEGYVVELPMQVGEVVEEGAVVASVASVQWIEISVDCPLDLADRVRDGEAYRVSPIRDDWRSTHGAAPAGAAGQEHGPGADTGAGSFNGVNRNVEEATWPARPATVVYASRIADPASQTFRVKLLADNRDLKWMAGIKVGVDFGEPLNADAIQAMGTIAP